MGLPTRSVNTGNEGESLFACHGFTTADTPWVDVNSNYTWLNAAQQEEDPDSILNFYRKAIHLRKSLPVVRHGDYREHYALSNKLYCYSRKMEDQKLLVVCNFTDKAVPFNAPKGFDLATAKLELQNYPAPGAACSVRSS